ncbi:MAG: zinc ribbon domain-containing protein [Oscillospiraceae bacterium]|nr:zinc ribbon domain-containing protein [Oscillospiraceae bacterium]
MSNFNSFFEKARFLANSASKKTGEILEISQLKLKISQIKASIERKYAELGFIYYSNQKAKHVENTETFDKKSQNLFKEIDDLFLKLHNIEKTCAEIKNKFKVEMCPCCGKKNKDNWYYCSHCGAKIYNEKSDTNNLEDEIED